MRGRPSLALVLAVVSARLSSAGDATAPGEMGYHTELSDVHTTCPTAHFDPSFKPDVKEHSVTVNDVHTTTITFWITLDRKKYTEDGFPDIFIDGHKQEYDPLRDLNHTVILNETIGGLEKELKIKVEDPYVRDGLHFTGKTATEYLFHIIQAPEWDLVVQAQNLRVTTDSGDEIQAFDPGKFDPKSDKSVHFYEVKETSCKKDSDSCMIYVEATCSDVATKVVVDGQQRRNGERVGFDMITFTEKVVTIECIYEDEIWTQGETQKRYYSVVLQRDIEFKGHVMVSLLPHEGICDQKLGTDGSEQGFDCRTNVNQPMLIVHATLTHQGEQIFVKYEEDDNMAEVKSGLPIQLQGIGNVMVRLEQGKDITTYPVDIHTAAECGGGMTCPQGTAYKEPSDHVRDHICKKDECDPAVDLPFCCGDRATCQHFDVDDCLEGTMVSESSIRELCKATVCKPDDRDVCCVDKNRCNTFDLELCPEDGYVRADAKKVPCKKMECSDEDVELCCVSASQQTCAWMPPQYCPEGTVVRTVDAWKSYCAGGTCSESDADTCCVEPAKCSTYECPDGLSPKQGAENAHCRVGVCDEKDLGTCCDVGAACSTAKCHRHQVLSSNANALWCSSDPCEEEDEDTCCVDHGNCDDFRSSCPEGESLVHRAEEVLCKQEHCNNDDDMNSCCTKRESCKNFQGKCPEGTLLWHGGLCEHESCTTSVTDKSLCCQPNIGQELEGLVMIQNAGYDKILDTQNRGTVESIVSTAISRHIGCDAHKVEVAVGRGMLGGIYCDFVIHTAGLNETDIADMRTKFQNKIPLLTRLNRRFANLEEVKVDPAKEMQVGFVLLADAMIDAAHGGIYIRGKLVEQDEEDQSWSIMLPGGFVEDGFAENHVHNIDDNSDHIGVDVFVDALTRLFRVAQLIEQGSIDADLKDWVPIPDSPAPPRTVSGGGGVPTWVFIVLIILFVAALLGGVAYLLNARNKNKEDEAKGLLS